MTPQNLSLFAEVGKFREAAKQLCRKLSCLGGKWGGKRDSRIAESKGKEKMTRGKKK